MLTNTELAIFLRDSSTLPIEKRMIKLGVEVYCGPKPTAFITTDGARLYSLNFRSKDSGLLQIFKKSFFFLSDSLSIRAFFSGGSVLTHWVCYGYTVHSGYITV